MRLWHVSVWTTRMFSSQIRTSLFSIPPPPDQKIRERRQHAWSTLHPPSFDLILDMVRLCLVPVAKSREAADFLLKLWRASVTAVPHYTWSEGGDGINHSTSVQWEDSYRTVNWSPHLSANTWICSSQYVFFVDGWAGLHSVGGFLSWAIRSIKLNLSCRWVPEGGSIYHVNEGTCVQHNSIALIHIHSFKRAFWPHIVTEVHSRT